MKTYVMALALGVAIGSFTGQASAANTAALAFNGASSRVELTTSAATNLIKGYTVEAWAYVDPPTTGARRILSNFQTNPPRGFGVGVTTITVNSVPAARWRLTTFGVKDYDTTAIAVTHNQWTHIAYVLDQSNTCHFYIDGVLGMSVPHTADARQSTHPLVIGRRPTGDEHWNGMLDEVRVWDHVRTQAQIQANMNSELSWDEPGLIGYWRLNEGSGTTTLDNSKNSADGTLFNATWVTGGLPVLSTPPTRADSDWQMLH